MPENKNPSLQQDFDTELARLTQKGLSPELETIARRYYSQKERDSLPESAFCGPHQSYPVQNESDFNNAVHLVGHADDPDAVKSCLKRKARANGWKLPDSWTEDEKKDGDRTATPDATRAANHAPFKGTHTHAHPAHGSQGDDMTHEHEHSHNDDNAHDHDHEDAKRATVPTHTLLYAPIVRIDKEKREVEGVATSEAVDSFGTIFSYEASKKAFQRWIERTANVREMHDKKAVGKGIGVRFDDDARKIYLRTRVSRSADGENSWIKLQEGILNGYSVGATNPVWDSIERNGTKYPYLVSYDLAETSLVDNASNPDGQGLVLCRADGLTDVIDTTEEQTTASGESIVSVASPSAVRAGARVSGDTRAALHDARNHALLGAMKTMKTCGCDDCMAAFNKLDPDDDNDIDFMGLYDPDGDAASLQDDDGDMDRAVTAALERILPALIERVMTPIYARQQQFLARMAQTPESPEPTITNTIDTTALEERLTKAIERLDTASSLSEVRDLLKSVGETVERIAAQPLPGGPVLNGAAYPVDKRLANQQTAVPQSDQTVVRAVLDQLQQQGALNSLDAQTAAAALLIQPMPGRRG